MVSYSYSAACRRANERRGRIQLLRAELDVQGERSVERTRTIETKSAYTVTAAAVVVGASIPILSLGSFGLFAVAPLILAAVTIYHATRAIRPLTLDVPSARQIVDIYLDADMTPLDLEDHLLELRTVEIEKRDDLNSTRSRAMALGFKFLTASVSALVLAALLSGALMMSEDANDKTPKPTPASSTEAP